jgi:hypothetical protein
MLWKECHVMDERLRFVARLKDWLGALDDFRNWLIREAA